MHLTATCADDLPHLLTEVETTIAPATAVAMVPSIQEGLAQSDLLPAQHLGDGGSIRARNLVTSRSEHQIDLVGPIYADRQWQAKTQTSFDVAHFAVDWEAQVVTCPHGHQSVRWCETQTVRGAMIHVNFASGDCTPCPARARCTHAKSQPRALTLQPRAAHEAIQAARQRQQPAEFATDDARRAGVEGTRSQGVRAFGLRQARYRSMAKTHLQHMATATAINRRRLADWRNGIVPAPTRCSHFAALAPTG